jgi:RNA polymerase sigma-70 factor (ECF subfamily)
MAATPFDYEASLAACAKGDQASLQELYLHEAPHMLALCYKMLSQRADAEDVVRDALVLVWKNAANYDNAMGTARAWIYSIMRYRVLNRLRQSGRPAPAHAEWVDTLPDGSPGHSDAGPTPLTQCIAQLDDAERRPLLMAFYNGFTYEQIAARLNTPADQVKTRVRAGLRAIQEREHA